MGIEDEANEIVEVELTKLLSESYGKLKLELLSDSPDLDRLISLVGEVNNTTRLICGEQDDLYEAWKTNLYIDAQNNASIVTGYQLA